VIKGRLGAEPEIYTERIEQEVEEVQEELVVEEPKAGKTV
jgi:hypothetical protein